VELEARYGITEAIYPLPEINLTEPSLVMTPHKDVARATDESARIGNQEEVNSE
jgi:hypothetical protein